VDIERISDYAVKVQTYHNYKLGDIEIKRVHQTKDLIFKIYNSIYDYDKVKELYEELKELCITINKKQIERMKEKSISFELTLFLSQFVNDVERISGHAYEISRDYNIVQSHKNV